MHARACLAADDERRLLGRGLKALRIHTVVVRPGLARVRPEVQVPRRAQQRAVALAPAMQTLNQ